MQRPQVGLIKETSGVSAGGGWQKGPHKFSLPLVWPPSFFESCSIVFDFVRVALFVLLNAILIAFLYKLVALISVLVCNRGEN